jgi:hypothetical protein
VCVWGGLPPSKGFKAIEKGQMQMTTDSPKTVDCDPFTGGLRQ